MIIFRIAIYLPIMTKQIEIIKKTRVSLLELVKDLSAEQLNKIPDGFNNNIIWNLAHMIAAQQGVCYLRAGLAPVTGEGFVSIFRSGTKPEGFVIDAGINEIKELMFTTLEQLEDDYANNLFANYTAWTTRYDVELANIDDAINFLPFHEGLHFGYIMAMKRVVSL